MPPSRTRRGSGTRDRVGWDDVAKWGADDIGMVGDLIEGPGAPVFRTRGPQAGGLGAGANITEGPRGCRRGSSRGPVPPGRSARRRPHGGRSRDDRRLACHRYPEASGRLLLGQEEMRTLVGTGSGSSAGQGPSSDTTVVGTLPIARPQDPSRRVLRIAPDGAPDGAPRRPYGRPLPVLRTMGVTGGTSRAWAPQVSAPRARTRLGSPHAIPDRRRVAFASAFASAFVRAPSPTNGLPARIAGLRRGTTQLHSLCASAATLPARSGSAQVKARPQDPGRHPSGLPWRGLSSRRPSAQVRRTEATARPSTSPTYVGYASGGAFRRRSDARHPCPDRPARVRDNSDASATARSRRSSTGSAPV